MKLSRKIVRKPKNIPYIFAYKCLYFGVFHYVCKFLDSSGKETKFTFIHLDGFWEIPGRFDKFKVFYLHYPNSQNDIIAFWLGNFELLCK